MTRRKADPDAERPEITQAECIAYRRKAARLKSLEDEVSALKRSLIDRVKRRATVEPGKWLPQVMTRESRHFSAEIVERAMGREAMLELRATIRPTIVDVFGIIESTQ